MASPPKDGSASPQPGEEGVTPVAGSSSAADGSSTAMASSPPPALRIQARAGGSSPETPTSSPARRSKDIHRCSSRLMDEEVARSLQGSHFGVCRKGRKEAGLNPREIDDEPERDAAPEIPPFDPVPCASTDSKPTASDGGCAPDEEYAGERNSECPPAAEERARAFGWSCSPGSRRWSAPPFRWCSMWREDVSMQKGRHPLSWKKRQPVVDRRRFLPDLPLFPLFLVLVADACGGREDGAEGESGFGFGSGLSGLEEAAD
ncbi:hypothetical protein E2562_037557 [Oryza meyeriana var. granulata]|uniref:Uncharacterized protein n=1 Tax=Oryza meyeriana var. granulata TaxID=110450 RepID=A0A6G1E7Y7_9ORYZ|nr:hypothetical protein E2562_037557 [Oryza meyeriana var. granulata]